VVTVARGPRGGLQWKGLPVAHALESGHAIRCAGVAIKIDNNKASAAKLYCGHSIRELRPPCCDLRGARCGFRLPLTNGGLLVELLGFLVPGNESGKNWDTCRSKLEGGTEILAHGRHPG
jgi:hypothetical protein